jgi:hypothetical protein
LIPKKRASTPRSILGAFQTTIFIDSPPLPMFQTYTAAGDQQKRHDKQQRAYRKHRRDQNTKP